MLTLGSLTFAAPWLLAALAVLPILWWLLRLTPPSPRRIAFPPIRLLFMLRPKEETPHRTPWWLILLRLIIAGLVIAGLAQPLWNANFGFPRNGPVMVVLDDGWAAAHGWEQRKEAAHRLINRAERNGRQVILATTAPQESASGIGLTPMPPATAAAQLAALEPSPWPNNRAAATDRITKAELPSNLNIFWLSDGIGSQKAETDTAFSDALWDRGTLDVMSLKLDLPLLVLPPERDADGLWARVTRAQIGAAQPVSLRALDREGRTLGISQGRFRPEERTARIKIDLPVELANRASRITLEDGQTAGSVALMDDGGGRKPIGLVTENAALSRQPMLGDLYFVERALAPNHEVRADRLQTLLKQELAVIVLTDNAIFGEGDRTALRKWAERGGMVVHFAGEKLAGDPKDDLLLPVRLRTGDRTLGGALSWTEPAHLATFPNSSPFSGLEVPKDVEIKRQVLAEPDIDLGAKTWARLTDGTPLVTGERVGNGFSVLFHVSSTADWSNLPISGLFVQMLNRLVMTASGVVTNADENRPLAPAQTLNAFGQLTTPIASAVAVVAKNLPDTKVGPLHPPGFYGPDNQHRALNIAPSQPVFAPLTIPARQLAADRTLDLAPSLFLIAFLLLIADMLIALALRGLLRRRGAVATASAGAIALWLLMTPQPSEAQQLPEQDILAATETTHLAYVRTGVPQVDATSRAGLYGITQTLLRRTSVDVGNPVAVDVEVDELSFYPFLYWPVTAGQRTPSPEAIDKLNHYLAVGGMILFDTADQNLVGMTGGDMGPGAQRLVELTPGLDVPRLIPMPPDHVLTKSFYLLRDFPGRWIGGTVWVEVPRGRVNDGVSGILVGSNDYAAAWATDEVGQPMFPVTPGGERQREMAFRFGINMIMYALTGNYKSDQVHVPAILERLGQ
ncbi:DUF4159 domain-containing protein [Dongia deserti]|uniref:DUF4159 domain-containing protein n=1 Tax=Dongia deserti TaxID=2268030 RepID=UPI000E6571FF|nr:DUF4159 domain-containing protein [Dongia deserti]